MFVVRKLDGELSFVLWFCRLAGAIRFAENKPAILARSGAHVTDRANSRTRPDERLAREKLLSVTTDTGIVVWEVSDIRKITFRGPGRGDLVARIASQTLMFIR